MSYFSEVFPVSSQLSLHLLSHPTTRHPPEQLGGLRGVAELAVMPLLVMTDRSAAAKEIVAAENNVQAAVSFEHYRHVLRTRGTPAPTSQARKERTTPRKNSLLIVLIIIFLPTCGGDTQGAATVQMEEAKGARMAIELTSSAFE